MHKNISKNYIKFKTTWLEMKIFQNITVQARVAIIKSREQLVCV